MQTGINKFFKPAQKTLPRDVDVPKNATSTMPLEETKTERQRKYDLLVLELRLPGYPPGESKKGAPSYEDRWLLVLLQFTL